MIPNRAYKYALITIIVVFALLLAVALLRPDKGSREVSPLRAPQFAQSAAMPVPSCYGTGINLSGFYLGARCNVSDTLRLFLDVEIRNGAGETIDEKTIETFLFSKAYPLTHTLSAPLEPRQVSIEVSSMEPGFVFVRARWGHNPWSGEVAGVFLVDNSVMVAPDDRGFVPFELFQHYVPFVIAVLE